MIVCFVKDAAQCIYPQAKDGAPHGTKYRNSIVAGRCNVEAGVTEVFGDIPDNYKDVPVNAEGQKAYDAMHQKKRGPKPKAE